MPPWPACWLTVCQEQGLLPQELNDCVPCVEPSTAAMPPRLQAAHTDLKMAQVKTISFLTFLLRIHTQLLAPHKVWLGSATVYGKQHQAQKIEKEQVVVPCGSVLWVLHLSCA